MTKVLEILNDGKWHRLEEIQQKTKLERNQFHQIIAFLERYCFVTVNKMRKEVMVDKTVQEFLAQKSTS